ncbi:MAG: LysR family transcriptional regulator [Roseovarius sp.]
MLPPNLSKSDLHLLYVFSVVAEFRGYSAAQIELNVSQSTISRQVSDLELRLGMKLCQRGRSGFRLTENGELVYRATQRLFASVREFNETIDGSRGKLEGNMSLAVIENWVFNRASPFSNALARFVDKAPDVTIELFSLAPDDIELAVQDGRVAFGLGVFHKHKPGLAYQTIGFEKMGLYCAKGHPLYDVTDPDRADAVLKTSLYAKRSYLREREVVPISQSLKTNARAHQIEGIAHLILTGNYVGFLPDDFAHVWVRDDTLRNVANGKYDQSSELKVVKKRGVDLNLVEQTFEGMLFDR